MLLPLTLTGAGRGLEDPGHEASTLLGESLGELAPRLCLFDVVPGEVAALVGKLLDDGEPVPYHPQLRGQRHGDGEERVHVLRAGQVDGIVLGKAWHGSTSPRWCAMQSRRTPAVPVRRRK